MEDFYIAQVRWHGTPFQVVIYDADDFKDANKKANEVANDFFNSLPERYDHCHYGVVFLQKVTKSEIN